ncbi:MAG: type II secretion system protein [Bacilli bacterium]|nr:type II secretion system protein [Bacilli bacterium]
MKNKKGFTLIELLAVIVILGLLMAIAIPSVTKYITQSRKKTLVNSIDSFITAAATAVNNNEFGALSNQDVSYYIPVSNKAEDSCISLEKGGTDPFGNWKEAYVVVNYDAESYSYDYYFTFIDDAGYGMELTKSDAIKPSGDGQILNPTRLELTNATSNRVTDDKIEIGDQDTDRGYVSVILFSPSMVSKTDGMMNVTPTVEACKASSYYTAQYEI